ncbi:MAG: hypothetical protein ACPL6D_07165 [Thermodesulfobacteriota bacterium]
MSKVSSKEERHILPEMTVLDVVSRYKGSEVIFKKFDKQAGVCICCNALFETLRDVAEKYGIELGQLLAELEAITDVRYNPFTK